MGRGGNGWNAKQPLKKEVLRTVALESCLSLMLPDVDLNHHYARAPGFRLSNFSFRLTFLLESRTNGLPRPHTSTSLMRWMKDTEWTKGAGFPLDGDRNAGPRRRRRIQEIRLLLVSIPLAHPISNVYTVVFSCKMSFKNSTEPANQPQFTHPPLFF